VFEVIVGGPFEVIVQVNSGLSEWKANKSASLKAEPISENKTIAPSKHDNAITLLLFTVYNSTTIEFILLS